MARTPNPIPIRKTLLLVVEGQTEQIYFNSVKRSLRMSNITIEPELAQRTHPKDILDMAINKKKCGDFDDIWCVFDLDIINEREREIIYKEAENNDIKIAGSLPCFEIWFLLHYRYSTKTYSNCDELIEELRSYIDGYNKNQKWLQRKDLFSFLKDLLDDAIKNSKQLEKYNRDNTIQRGSMTQIYKILEKIKERNNEPTW